MASEAATLPSRTSCCTDSGSVSTNARRLATHVLRRSKRRASSSIEQPKRLSISRQQPALFDRALRLAHPQRPVQRQRVGFAHLPDDGVDRVAAQLLERGDALVAVDDQIAAAIFDDDDGRLLADLSQRSDQPTLARRMPYPEAFQAAVQLMKLQSHRRQYAPARIWSFPAGGEVRRKAPWNQLRYAWNWSFAVRSRSVPRTPIKSAPWPPNWSFARSQGSRFNGDGVRTGSADLSWLRWVIRWAVA